METHKVQVQLTNVYDSVNNFLDICRFLHIKCKEIKDYKQGLHGCDAPNTGYELTVPKHYTVRKIIHLIYQISLLRKKWIVNLMCY